MPVRLADMAVSKMLCVHQLQLHSISECFLHTGSRRAIKIGIHFFKEVTTDVFWKIVVLEILQTIET